jgi:hypothetical protein
MANEDRLPVASAQINTLFDHSKKLFNYVS